MTVAGSLHRACWILGVSLVFWTPASLRADEPSSNQPPEPKAYRLLASNQPLLLISQELTRSLPVELTSLVPATASPHHYSMKPSDLDKLRNADFVLWLGSDHEPYIKLARQKHLALLEHMDGSRLIYGQAHSHDHSKNTSDSDHVSIRDHRTLDPHFWLDPDLAHMAATLLSQELEKTNPQWAEQLNHNLLALRQQLDQLDIWAEHQLRPVKSQPFIVMHRAYDYLIRHYRLEGQMGVLLQGDRGSGLKHMAGLQARTAGQSFCFFHEPQYRASRLPVFIQHALEGGQARALELDPLGIEADTYPNLIKNLVNQLVRCNP